MSNNSTSPTPRFDEEGDWLARQFFSSEELRMPPEEYAARNAHRWGCFSFHFYHYQDEALGAWIKRVGALISSPEELEHLRGQILTPAERAAIEKEQAKGF